MTDLITRDPNDTGEIIRGELEETRNLGPKIGAALANISPNLRSAAATEVITICEEPILVNPARPATLEDRLMDYDQGGYPPMSPPKPPPPPPSPNWAAPAGHYPTYRTVPYALPAGYRRQGRIYRGRHARSPRWAWALVWAATPVTVVCLAVFAVWQVTR